jgi:hypothetical protein
MSDDILKRIRTVELELDDLNDLVAEWDGMSRDEQLNKALDWEWLMYDCVTVIEEQRRKGNITTQLDERYRTLRVRLESAKPVISLLGLLEPEAAIASIDDDFDPIRDIPGPN